MESSIGDWISSNKMELFIVLAKAEIYLRISTGCVDYFNTVYEEQEDWN